MRQIDADNEPSEENSPLQGEMAIDNEGRIGYKDTNNINEYLDFNINIIHLLN